MVSAIRYRGPDDSGVWSDHAAGLALGHARLSILDLSPEGHQPMLSTSGRYVISYDGEVYNFAELRTELGQAGAKFHGHSDTEVMLAVIELMSPWKRTTGQNESTLPASWSITWMGRRVVGGRSIASRGLSLS
jgi:asparagine synthetase B (glutamine-hydrolysing)